MPSRRSILLAGVLVALNLALWLTPAGLAVRQSAIESLFGKSLMRADVVEANGADWRFDRGVVTSVSSSALTLQELDTKTVTIGLAPSTHFSGGGRRLQKGWRVFVTWLGGTGTAVSVQVEKRGH